MGRRIAAPIRSAFDTVIDVLLPRQCLKCGTIVGGEGALCAVCWSEMTFLAPPFCESCGYPFELDIEAAGDGLCGACLRNPPPWTRARAVFRYDESSRHILLGFKHGDRTHAAPAFGRWLYRAAGELADEGELVIPVPLHRWRLFRRRYNQAALLAQAFARIAGIPYAGYLLRRVRATPSQGRLSRRARRLNVRGAFAVPPGQAHRVKGRQIILVDDVLTTGATAGAAARCLLRAGAKSVDVLTLARVVRPDA